MGQNVEGGLWTLDCVDTRLKSTLVDRLFTSYMAGIWVTVLLSKIGPLRWRLSIVIFQILGGLKVLVLRFQVLIARQLTVQQDTHKFFMITGLIWVSEVNSGPFIGLVNVLRSSEGSDTCEATVVFKSPSDHSSGSSF